MQLKSCLPTNTSNKREYNYAMDIIYQNPNFHLWMFGAAFVIGYAGQRLVYKYLGSAEKFLDKKVGDKLG